MPESKAQAPAPPAPPSPPAPAVSADAPSHPKLRILSGDLKEVKQKVMIYGRSGVGKTTFACDLAMHYRCFYMCNDIKKTSIISHPQFSKFRPNLHTWDAFSWGEAAEGFNWVADNQKHFDWVVIDHLTDLNKRIQEEILGSSKEEVLSQREWGKVKIRMEKFIRFIRDLNMNVLFLALSSGEKNELTGEIKQHPALTGTLKEEVPAYLTTIGYAYTAENRTEPGKVLRYVGFQDTPRYTGKDEFRALEIEPFDCDHFLRKTKLVS